MPIVSCNCKVASQAIKCFLISHCRFASHKNVGVGDSHVKTHPSAEGRDPSKFSSLFSSEVSATEAHLGTSCSAGLPLVLFQAVQLAAQAVILLAVQRRLSAASIQCAAQLCRCSHRIYCKPRLLTQKCIRDSTFGGCAGQYKWRQGYLCDHLRECDFMLHIMSACMCVLPARPTGKARLHSLMLQDLQSG